MFKHLLRQTHRTPSSGSYPASLPAPLAGSAFIARQRLQVALQSDRRAPTERFSVSCLQGHTADACSGQTCSDAQLLDALLQQDGSGAER